MNAKETENNPRSTPNDRVIRVFISSTFRDMMRERDVLVKKVFPDLRRKCAKRFITFTEVDLRWGITKEQSAEGQVLPLCLAEIERSRPYFLGLLGERYGWIPDSIRPEIIDREPWLKEHVHDRTSVTELEILHGVLNNPKMAGHAFFYFRDPAYGLDPKKYPDFANDERRDLIERNIPAEVEKYGEAEATRRTEERKAKLLTLKQRIRDSGLPLVDPYSTPEALAETVRKQLDELIDRLYPENQTPDPLTQERLVHEAHAKNILFGCIERPAHMKALTDFADRADTGGKGFVLTGESGGGKTALLAAWARDWSRHNPDDFLFQHFFGATPDSASPEGFLQRLMGELKQRFGIAGAIPADPEKLRDAMPVWLAMTPSNVKIALVLDGLNQVQGGEPDRRLRFLPRQFPTQVTVIASALSGPTLDALRERGWAEYELPKVSEAEADAMVAEYLRQIGRFVDAEGRPIKTPLRRQIVAAPGSRNPLFLRTVLEELRQFGSFEKLPARVAHYLEARDPKELFLRVIRRWQEDFDGWDPEGRDSDLVRRALTSLWAARQGLSEPEWLDLLGDGSHALPHALWSPIYLALEPHLSQRASLFTFGHDFLRQAVESIFLETAEQKKEAHYAIADYFIKNPANHRSTAELPWQLLQIGEIEQLRRCLLDLCRVSFFRPQEYVGYWISLGEERKFPILLRKAFAATQRTADVSLSSQNLQLCIALIFWHAGAWQDAFDFLSAAVNFGKSTTPVELCAKYSGDRNGLLNLHMLANILYEMGERDESVVFHELIWKARRTLCGEDDRETLESLHFYARGLGEQGRLEDARQYLELWFKHSSNRYGERDPDTLTCLYHLGRLCKMEGDPLGAERFYLEVLEGRKTGLGPLHPDTLTIYQNYGVQLTDMGRFKESIPYFQAALEGRRLVLGRGHTNTLTTQFNYGKALYEVGSWRQGYDLCLEAYKIANKQLGPAHPLSDSFLRLMPKEVAAVSGARGCGCLPVVIILLGFIMGSRRFFFGN